MHRKTEAVDGLMEDEREQLVAHSRGIVTEFVGERGEGYTGFAFSGEGGHVPQITENLKMYKSLDQDIM